MSLETSRLILLPCAPEQLLALIEHPERFEELIGFPAADGLREFAGILVVAEVGFLLIERFPVLLALEVAAIALATIMRWRRIRRAGFPRGA
jgi:hypothetical protein